MFLPDRGKKLAYGNDRVLMWIGGRTVSSPGSRDRRSRIVWAGGLGDADPRRAAPATVPAPALGLPRDGGMARHGPAGRGGGVCPPARQARGDVRGAAA